jgi:hypothetical protein
MPCVLPEPGPPSVRMPRATSSPPRQNCPVPTSSRRLFSPQNAPSRIKPSGSGRRKRRYSRRVQKCDDPNAPRLIIGVRRRSMRSRSQPPFRSRLCKPMAVIISMKARNMPYRNRRIVLMPGGAPTSRSITPLAFERPRFTAWSPSSIRYEVVTVSIMLAYVAVSPRRCTHEGFAPSSLVRRMPAPSSTAVKRISVGVQHSSGSSRPPSISCPSVNSQ